MSFDSTSSSIRQQIMHWLCYSELNQARETVCQGAIGYRCYIGRKKQRTEAKDLQLKVRELQRLMK